MKTAKQTKKWTAKDKSRIRICDMEDNHLINTISMLQRKAEEERAHYSLFYLTCNEPTGDMAQLAFEQEQNAVFESSFLDYTPPIYQNLIDDAERRGLKIPQINSLIADSDIASKLLEGEG